MPTRLILHSKYIITNLLIEDLLQQSSQNFQSNAIGFQLMKFLNSEDLKWINNSWLNFFNPSFIKVTNSLHQTSYSSIVLCHDLSDVNMTGKTTLRIITNSVLSLFEITENLLLLADTFIFSISYWLPLSHDHLQFALVHHVHCHLNSCIFELYTAGSWLEVYINNNYHDVRGEFEFFFSKEKTLKKKQARIYS